MRIALVTPAFPPSTGGVEIHVARIASGLTSLGVEVEVFTGSRDGCTSPGSVEHRDGLTVHRFPAWRTAIISCCPRLLFRTMHLDSTFDVIHVHSYHSSAALTALVGRTRAVVFTPHFHGSGHTRLGRLLHTVYRRFSSALFTSSSAVICVSDAERSLVRTRFPRLTTPMTVIPNGVDAAAITAAAPYPDESSTLVFHGRLEPYKHVDRVIAAMTELPQSVQLIVIGDGSARGALASESLRLGLGDRVRFLGQVDTPTLHRWLRTAQVCVSLSEHEAFGIAPLEAACAGSRIVLSDIPAHREIAQQYIGGGVALVPSAADVTALARAITSQLSAAYTRPTSIPDWTDVAEETLLVYRQAVYRHATHCHALEHPPKYLGRGHSSR
ncbi:glycosyltransferase family 4 protein [Rhodococcus sp. OK302]|uniref:glycosyltransferase family 4 protein n=1 Tax=Rhodococcus sp. OK302 TaxID=1882769 RepID=UPI000B93CF4E|nr:glycosyltransferase family 4 protein [Rhodococcus sp. OK302]OYD68857.1 glycosyltransferase involved in cell wall bisynthesis [Rhodococcus sp. OK302]